MLSPKQWRINARLAHANTLLCNVGLAVSVVVAADTGRLVWVIQTYDEDGVWCGPYSHYRHERSMMRAAWRLYRQHTGD